ncbi:15773_t:CDS:2, partial [Racocetra persica]
MNDNMELYDILLCIENIKYPHTSDHIRNTVISKITSIGLNDKVKIAVTNSSFNMVKAIREWEDVERVPCSAHTLQLYVTKALSSANQDLSNLNLSELTSDKETDETTIHIPLKILRTINECNTRWESNNEAKKDYKILKNRVLKYWEWDLLDHLIKLFQPIEEATEWLSGQ